MPANSAVTNITKDITELMNAMMQKNIFSRHRLLSDFAYCNRCRLQENHVDIFSRLSKMHERDR